MPTSIFNMDETGMTFDSKTLEDRLADELKHLKAAKILVTI